MQRMIMKAIGVSVEPSTTDMQSLHEEGTTGRSHAVNDTGLWWLVRPSVIIITMKYNSKLQRQILEAQKDQFFACKTGSWTVEKTPECTKSHHLEI